jgi:hypothetical protein
MYVFTQQHHERHLQAVKPAQAVTLLPCIWQIISSHLRRGTIFFVPVSHIKPRPRSDHLLNILPFEAV